MSTPTDSRSASLLIQNVCDEDIAEYACVGQNTRAKTHLELSAKETPALEKLPEVKVASMGKSVKLNCKLANLNDKVQWNKNRKYLLNESERAKYTKYSLDRGKLYKYHSNVSSSTSVVIWGSFDKQCPLVS